MNLWKDTMKPKTFFYSFKLVQHYLRYIQYLF